VRLWRADSSEVDNRPESAAPAEQPTADGGLQCSHKIRFSAAPLFCSDGKIQVVPMTTHVMESLKTLI